MDGHNHRLRPCALRAGEGWIYGFGIDFTVKAREVQEGSGAAFLEYVAKQGEEPEDHTHRTEDEIFYVLEGAITFRCGEESFDLEKKDFIFRRAASARLYNSERDSDTADREDLTSQGGIRRRVGRFRGRSGVRAG